MNTMIMHVDRACEWQPVLWILAIGGSEIETGQVVIELNSEWISVLPYDEVIYSYDEAELQLLKSIIKDFNSYIIEWKGDVLVQRLVDAAPIGGLVVIDNDHGIICLVDGIKKIPIKDWTRASHII